MHRWAGAVVIALLSMPACGRDGDSDARWRRLEERVSVLERASATASAPGVSSAVADDLRSLERRLAALERRVVVRADGAPVGPATGSATDVGEARFERRRERRARLRDLTDEYRARLSVIRQEETDPAARQQAVREALEWYRDQRRAILAGRDPVASQ